MKNLKLISRIAIALSALLMVSAYFLPLWRILMWAPQYPEWLGLKIWINNITGDLNTINALNHYIGMKHIKVEMFPEFTYLPYIVACIIGFGLLAPIINKRWSLFVYLGLLIAAGVGAIVDFYLWGYDYGHNLDPTAAIQVPGMSYQPPLIGTKQLLNFTAFSGPDVGGWVFIGSAIIVAAVIVFEIVVNRKKTTT
jgi:copper chaperone NosL